MDSKDSIPYNVYVGAETGILKGVAINNEKITQKNFHNLKALERDNEISAMAWSAEQDRILLGLRNQTVKIYDTEAKAFTSCMEVRGGKGPIKGIGMYDGSVVTAVESGLVRLWRYEAEQQISIETITPSADKNLCRMRQSCTNRRRIATGGKENDLQLWDLSMPNKSLFKAKNVRPDMLELRVPVWVSDMAFLPGGDKVAVCTRHSHVRVYDPSIQQKRPVINSELEDSPFTCLCVSNRENQVILGTSRGSLLLFDLRRPGMVHMYKGLAGGVRDVTCVASKPYVASVGLDRYLRLHHIQTKRLLHKVYLKSRLNCVLMRSDFSLEVAKQEPPAAEDSDDDCVIVDELTDELWDSMVPGPIV